MIDRRTFLKSSGFLTVGFWIDSTPLATTLNFENQQAFRNPVNSWIRLNSEGSVTVLTGKTELGQGIKTALMQIAAEELDLDMDRMNIIIAQTDVTPDERYTAGSASIEGSGRSIRFAAATAKAALLELASTRLKTPVSTLGVENGLIKKVGSALQSTYWELLEGAELEMEVDTKIALKDPAKYSIVGKPFPRKDIKDMATAIPYFIHDMRLPNMVHARILRPPGHGAILRQISTDKVNMMPGVLKVVQDGSFAGVIATGEYQAIKAMAALSASAIWEKTALSPTQDSLFSDMDEKGSEAELVLEAKGFKSIFAQAAIQHEATYQRPYHMHGSIGPSCSIAVWDNNSLTIWSSTQGVYPLRKTLANLLSISESQIKAYSIPGAGCYGHNGADDVSAHAALLARQIPGKPVRVQWMREDEHSLEPYGPAMMHRMKAGISAEGRITAWETELWSDSHSTRPGGNAGHFIAARTLAKPFRFSAGGFSGGSYRNAEPLYDFESTSVKLHNYKGPLRTSALRGLGAYANIFAIESFMDELAEKAGQDPVSFRLKHLSDERAKAVIKLAAEKTGMGKNPEVHGTGRGIGFAKYKNQAAYCAVVAEVELDEVNKGFKLVKLTAAIDAGQTINSDGLENQTSGGMIQSASWTLFEEVKYDEFEVNSTNWATYPIMRFGDVPDTEVFIIDRPEMAPMGAGEAAQGPTAAAIANAVFAATGKRVRNLPLQSIK